MPHFPFMSALAYFNVQHTSHAPASHFTLHTLRAQQPRHTFRCFYTKKWQTSWIQVSYSKAHY